MSHVVGNIGDDNGSFSQNKGILKQIQDTHTNIFQKIDSRDSDSIANNGNFISYPSPGLK